LELHIPQVMAIRLAMSCFAWLVLPLNFHYLINCSLANLWLLKCFFNDCPSFMAIVVLHLKPQCLRWMRSNISQQVSPSNNSVWIGMWN